MQESGLSFYHTHTLYKILSAKGAKDFNVFKYGYDPLSAYVDIKKVIIYRKNGEIEELDMSEGLRLPGTCQDDLLGRPRKNDRDRTAGTR